MATSYLATNYRVGDGSTTIWNVSFAGARPDQGDGTEAYLDPDSIQAVRIDTASDGSETETPLEGALLSPTQYEITPAVAQDVRIKIYRSTEREYPLVDFTDFASISEADLDIQARQTLYSVQELNDVILYSDKRSVAASLNAQEALDSARAAQTDVSLAVDTANDAESTANAASSTAGSALTASSQALNTANSADEKADTAVSTANSADEKADTAIGTANTALSTANAAETAATNANSSANAAVSTANSADEKADTAVSTANAAASDAGAAVMTANAAESKADDALAVATDITDFQGQLDDLSDRLDSLVGLDTGDLLLGSNNLNGLSNYATARSNLDVYSTTQVDARIASSVGSLEPRVAAVEGAVDSVQADVSEAQDNISGLQTNKADKAVVLSAGDGLSGGGDLSANRAISLGTPGTLSGTSTNSVASGSHTHAISSTTARNNPSTSQLLAAAAMNDHRVSSDHDSRYPVKSNNLSDLPSASAARSNLGLGTSATKNEGPGSGLNADTLDGEHGSYYANVTARLGFVPVQQNGGQGMASNKVYIGWDGGGDLLVQVDNSQMGAMWTDASGLRQYGARATAGGIGTYAFLGGPPEKRNPGTTRPGSELRWTNAEGKSSSQAPNGTWRLMGYIPGSSSPFDKDDTSLWLRIS